MSLNPSRVRGAALRVACVAWGVSALIAAQQPKPPVKPVPGKAGAAPESAPAPVEVSDALKKDAEEIAAALGCKLPGLAESESFEIAAALGPAQCTPILDGAERSLKVFKEWTGATTADLFGPRKCLIVVAPTRKEYLKLGTWYETYFKQPNVAGAMKSASYWPFDNPRCLIATHLKPNDAATIKQICIHEVGHLVVSRYKFNYNFPPAWLLEGMGALLEAKVSGMTTCYCFSGGYAGAAATPEKLNNLKWENWKKQVKLEAKTGVKSIKQILPMELKDLTALETGKCWSVIDYLVTTDKQKFTQFLTLMKSYWPRKIQYEWSPEKGEAQEKALKEAYGFDFATLDAEWAKYVATY
jgi:hypothetical protein